MGRFVNPDNSAFQDVLNSKVYVDKTGLLDYINSVIDTTDKFICNSRPRRFGKKPDFHQYLNQYEVIHFDVQWCMVTVA